MKKFLQKGLLYILILISFFFFLQYLVDSGLRMLKNDDTYGDWNRIFDDEIDVDVAVLGSSRAWVHINPDSIENITGLKAYNFGVDGSGLYLQRAKWLSYIHFNQKPRYVIQDMGLIANGRNNNLYGKEQYLPYYNHSEVYEIIKEFDSWVEIERIVPFLKYRGYGSSLFEAFQNGIISPLTNIEKNKGFSGQHREWTDYNTVFAKQKENERIRGIQFKVTDNEALRLLIQDCKERNIHLVFVHTPIYHEMTQILTQQDEFIAYFTQLAQDDENIEFWDFSLMKNLSYDRQYFYNATHLNYKGAAILSDSIAHRLKRLREQQRDLDSIQ